MNEEWELANNIELLTQGAIEKGNLDTCMIYGISGNCGKNCPKFKDKTCEEYLTTLENEYNNLQSKIDKANEYIEEHFIFDDKNGEYYQTHTFDKDNAKELHDILKED